MGNEAIVATDVTKYFGEGEARMTAVNRVSFTAHFGEMLFVVNSLSAYSLVELEVDRHDQDCGYAWRWRKRGRVADRGQGLVIKHREAAAGHDS